MESPGVCIDLAPPPKTLPERLALLKGVLWERGDGIRITFMDGDPSVQNKVAEYARLWTEHADLLLFFGDFPKPDIRISFEGKGNWSVLGTQCRKIPPSKPTMNLDGLTPKTPNHKIARVVLHEFGHALGCIHEHQNPTGGIKWNAEAVYEYYAGPPNYWTPKQVYDNIIKRYSTNITVRSTFDPLSIMIYPIDKSFTLDGYQVGYNSSLSEMDKSFIAEIYS